MATSSSIIQFLLVFFFLTQLPSSFSQPADIIFDIERDPSTLQYWINITQGTPLAGVKLVLDLGGELPWFRCHKAYNSSSVRPVECASPMCSQASKPFNSSACMHKNACSIYTSNPITRSVGNGVLVSDVVAVKSNRADSIRLPVASPYGRYAFGCADTSNVLRGLAKGAQGVAGLGRSSGLSLVKQLADNFRLPPIFALELYENSNDNTVLVVGTSGMIYFGGGSYFHYDYIKMDYTARVLTYTPLLINPKRREEYFIDLKSIVVHSTTLQINQKLLSINNKTGTGGTKVDIQVPFTTLETSIYKAFMNAHTKWAKTGYMGIPIQRVTSVAPFSVCYNSSTLNPWPALFEPTSLSFVFPAGAWNISYYDLLPVRDGVSCVAFLDGGPKPKTSIVIGARQIGFMEFDIKRSRLGFVQPSFRKY